MRPLNSLCQVKRKLKSDTGNTILITTGVLSLVLLFASAAINIAQYYTFKTKLTGLANTIASHAGNSLPDPVLAAAEAKSAFNALKVNLLTEEQAFPETLALKIYFDYYKTNPLNQTATPTLARLEYVDASTKLELPIKSMTIKLSASFSYSILDLTESKPEGLSLIPVSASSTTQLSPTDVVLIIENTNSVVSPMKQERADGEPIDLDDTGFSMWNGDFPGRKGATYGVERASVSKATLRARQCFGEITENLKRSALFIFDTLSSAATYRVGVIHTTPFVGEYNAGDILITPSSYAQSYVRKPNSSLPVDLTAESASNYDSPLLKLISNRAYGSSEFSETRCAALANNDLFPVPTHPLSTALKPGPLKTELQPSLSCAGSYDAATCPDLGHLTFDPDTDTLLPRERIWIKSAGDAFESGTLNPRHNYTHLQFAIQRAMDMLAHAPKRADNLKVERRMVLVLADGFEKRFTQDSGYNATLDESSYTFSVENVLASDAFTKSTLGQDHTLVNNPAIFENPCEVSAKNIIHTNTSVSTTDGNANLNGTKLGLLYYGDRSAFLDTDPLLYLRDLAGHSYSSAEITLANTSCRQRWASLRGKFMLEASPATLPDVDATDGSIGQSFVEDLTPQVVRSMLVSELVTAQ